MKFVAWDLETHLIQPGLLSPPIVCHSFATKSFIPGDGKSLQTKENGILEIAGFLSDTGHVIIAGANVAFDFGCLLAERPDLFPLVWKAYEEGRVWDVQIAATLVAIAEGRLREGELFDKKGQKMKSNGKITSRYSLNVCVQEWLGRTDAKDNDRFRMSYALLENTPIEYWPEDAKQYPIDDAVNTLEVAIAQRDSGFDFADLKVQCHAAFCAHLSAMVGLRTNSESVQKLKGELREKELELQKWAFEKGFLRANKDGTYSKDTKAIASAVTRGYGGSAPTTPKGGVSLSRETLEDSGDSDLERLAEIGKVQKLQTYIPTLEEAARVPLNVRPNILLSTGRASMEGLIQLIPRKGSVREAFCADRTWIEEVPDDYELQPGERWAD